MTLGGHRGVLASLGLAIAVFMVQGCSALTPAPVTRIDAGDFRIQLIADADANDFRPVAVDLVQVSDAALLARIETLDAADWFRARGDVMAENPGKMSITSWEVVAAQRVALATLPPGPERPMASLVYALYGSPGTHRVRLPAGTPVVVHLARTSFTATAR
ncbi:hypothetical protein N825_33850 [Skermanella stibiiresistens SB22]|uniref:Type VI secretion protein n=1 Tax=Skermanella stibiiresistens SB22 TaxID=1385369 RepID=W9HAN3_9PROT|nr:hypothetical protein [Skermanella stibiiresistens]EWY40918.1 hypothetical protein N825_33850 [Skermanella stibiiresistens SB22]